MKLDAYYALVINKKTNRYDVLACKRQKLAEGVLEAYARWIKDLESNQKGYYTTSALKFGKLSIKYVAKEQTGDVYIGMTQVGVLTANPTLASKGVELTLGTLYLSPVPTLDFNEAKVFQLRDVVAEVLIHAIWELR